MRERLNGLERNRSSILLIYERVDVSNSNQCFVSIKYYFNLFGIAEHWPLTRTNALQSVRILIAPTLGQTRSKLYHMKIVKIIIVFAKKK